MSDQNNAMKNYMSNNHVFADAFNYFAYDGKKVIKPEGLTELDPNEIMFLEEREKKDKSEKDSINAERDVFKVYALKKYKGCIYCLMGVENQTYINYAGPYTTLTYDYFRIRSQVRRIMKDHYNTNDLKNDHDEFLSRFAKTDKIKPVITLMIYWQGKKWDGPRYLHEMYEGKIPVKLRKMMLDHKLNLVEPASMCEADFAKFGTELGNVLEFSKYSEDRKAMEAFYKSVLNKNIDTDAARVIDAIGNIGMKFKEGEKVTNVCKSIEEMKKENKEEGRAEGRVEGRVEGRAEGRSEGKLDGILMSVKTVMKKMKMSAEQAMDFLEVSADMRAALLKML